MENNIDKLRTLLTEDELMFFDSLANGYQKNFANTAFAGKKVETQEKNLFEVKHALELKCKNIFDYKKKVNPRDIDNTMKDMTDEEKIITFFKNIESEDNKDKVQTLYFNLIKDFESLNLHYGWNQPMITSNNSFICAFSVAKNHFTIGLEKEALDLFENDFKTNEYEMLKKGIKIKWSQDINYELLKEVIAFSINLKKDAKGFWK